MFGDNSHFRQLFEQYLYPVPFRIQMNLEHRGFQAAYEETEINQKSDDSLI